MNQDYEEVNILNYMVRIKGSKALRTSGHCVMAHGFGH